MEITDEEKTTLLNELNDRYGYDFRQYSAASLRRRIVRFAHIFRIENYFDLRHHLLNDEKLFASFILEVTVNVTEMFRDPDFFIELREKVFPVLETYPFIKIWHAGCSTGEEVYSMAIALEEAGLYEKTKLYATDLNTDVIAKARDGIFSVKSMKEYTSNYMRAGGTAHFSDYYTAAYGNAIFSDALKRNMIFSVHNLVSDNSFNEFNLIICRNVLIYFQRSLQERVFKLFEESLSIRGFLVLGSKESLSLSPVARQFTEFSKRQKIYRHKN